MTEMLWRKAFSYAAWLGEHAQLFFSINHARNAFTVAELMAFAGMACRERSGAMDVDGYVPNLGYREEIYALRRSRFAGARSEAFHVFISLRSRARRALRALLPQELEEAGCGRLPLGAGRLLRPQ